MSDTISSEIVTPVPAGVTGTTTVLRNPFESVRARYALIWLVIGQVIAAIVLIAVRFYSIDMDKTANLTLSLICVQGVLLAWVLVEIKRASISLKRLFFGDAFLPRKVFKHLLIMIPSMVFTVGSVMILAALVGLLFNVTPDSVIPKNRVFSVTHASSVLQYIMSFIALVIIAPLSEELAFRGILVNRWGFKWGLTKAIIFSSLFFGILHGISFLGMFCFGVLLSLMYFRTRSLLPGIFFHATNNLLAFLLMLASLNVSQDDLANASSPSVAGYLVSGAILLALSVPFLVMYLRRNWPGKGASLPYAIQAVE